MVADLAASALDAEGKVSTLSFFSGLCTIFWGKFQFPEKICFMQRILCQNLGIATLLLFWFPRKYFEFGDKLINL